jgi:Ca-activated chloride channel homolog
MRRGLKRFVIPALMAAMTLLVVPAASPQGVVTNVELILDASGSMYAALPAGGSRIAVAKDVLSSFVNKLPADPNLNVGLRIYGATAAAGSAGACKDSKLVLPIKGVDRSALIDTVVRTRPKGSTPIAYSLEQAGADFAVDKSRKLIVLVTDGIESCNGDLKKAVQSIKDRGIDVDLRVIGIDLDAAAQKSFDGVGTFENATSASELASALGKATKSVAQPTDIKLPVTVKLVSSGKPVTSGAKVTFTSVIDPKNTASFSPANGMFTSQLTPGTYFAHIEVAGSRAQDVEGLSVATGASNTFTFEVSQASPVQLDFTPKTPIAGGKLKVAFSGAPASSKSDWISIARQTDRDGAYLTSVYVSGVSGTVEMIVPDGVGPYEVRYHLSKPEGGTSVIGRSAPFTPQLSTITLDAPPEVAAGSTFKVKWTGPNNETDYITVVKKGAAEGVYTSFQYTKQGNPVSLVMPVAPGEYEVRYSSDTSRKTLSSRPITAKASTFSLDGPSEAAAGTKIQVRWTGPNNPGDYVLIVKKGAAVGTYINYFYTKAGNPGILQMPTEPGDYELRYSTEAASPNPTLASRPIKITGGSYSITAPSEAKAGQEILVKWTGPNGDGDYVTIVKQGAAVGTYTSYFYTSGGSPGKLELPKQPGSYELRYSTERISPNPTLFSVPITLK